MEQKQFISDALIRSPQPNLSFQADKFTKKNNLLSIPDTIHEQSSAELSGDSIKMEVKDDFDDKENIIRNQQIMCNESLDNSKIITIDNSFIKNCERKLLENSNSDEEKAIDSENKSEEKKQFLGISRIFPNNDSISTPPSALRKEISILRSELAAADEFHDLEIQLLKEEKSGDTQVDLKNYLEVLEKNAALMDLYTTLKNEYDEYRKEQEKVRHEFQSKTADCLESLCSQIEASDSSLNFSSASFVSFNGGIKSSTLLEDVSEMEATVMHDATVLATDPLSITCDAAFKTPMQTPMRSAKKLFPQDLNSAKTPVVREVKEIEKRHSSAPLDSEYNIQLLNLEAMLYDKRKEVENLEQRLFKVEDMYNGFKSEYERMKESLTKKTEQLNELTQKLFTETISLNPGLRDSLAGVSGAKLLYVFIETIMEKCKNIQEELIIKHSCERSEWEAKRKIDCTENEDLQEQIRSLNERVSSQEAKLTGLEDLKANLERQLTDAENTILTREVEMRILQSSVRQAQEDFTSAAETLSKLESQLSLSESERKEVEHRCERLEETVKNLKEELEQKENISSELDGTKSELESSQKENESLKQMILQTEELIAEIKSESAKKLADTETIIQSREDEIRSLQSRVTVIQNDLDAATQDLSQLQCQFSLAQTQKETAENEYQQLQGTVESLKKELDSKAEVLDELRAAVENIRTENEGLKQTIQHSEETIARLQSESLQTKEEFNAKFVQEIESLKRKEECRFDPLFEVLEECRKNTGVPLSSNSESSFSESRAFDLLPEKLHSCPDPQLLSAVQAVIDFVKEEWDSKRKVDLTVIENLQNQIKTVSMTITEKESKLDELLAENNEFSTLCENLKEQLQRAEETVSTRNAQIASLKRQEDLLKQLKGDLDTFADDASDLPTERIEKLITQLPDLQDSSPTGETQIVPLFVETLRKTCKEVQNELIKKIESEKTEWESQRTADLNLIDSLKTEIKELSEKADLQETRFAEINLEKEDLQKLHDEVTAQMMDARNTIANRDEEIASLRSHESALRKAEEGLAVAEETILTLKEQLSSAESVKTEVESRCRELQEAVEELKSALESSEKLHNATKSALESVEKRNEKLKEMIDESERVMDRLRSESCQHNSEELVLEIESLKSRESRRFSALLEIVEDSRKRLEEVTAENCEAWLSENSLLGLISEKLTERADSQLLSAVTSVVDFVKIEWDTKRNNDLALIEDLRNQISSLTDKLNEYEAKISEILSENSDCNKLCGELRSQLSESEKRLSVQEAEIAFLKKEEDVLTEMRETVALADETISKLNTQLSLVEAEKKAVEHQCQSLEDAVGKLKDELSSKEKLEFELESAQKESEDLKQLIQQSEETITRLELESSRQRKELAEEIESLKGKEEFRLKVLSEILEECRGAVADSAAPAFDLVSNKLHSCPDLQLSSAVKAVLDLIKTDWESKRKEDLTAIESLQNQMKTVSEKNREFEDLKVRLCEAEEVISTRNAQIASLKRQEDLLKQLKGDLDSLADDASDLPTERIEKLITQLPDLQDNSPTGETQIVPLFVETLRKTCKEVQNELIKKIESEKTEWESQRTADLNLIISLQAEIKELSEKADLQETRIAEINLEKEDLQKLRDDMKNQMAEAEGVISTCKEEIRLLRCQEAALKRAKEELSVAEDTILTLKAQLASTESRKEEVELRCQGLEEGTVRLRAEIETKETIIEGLEELKQQRERTERENDELKQRVVQSEDVILQLRRGLEAAKEEHGSQEGRIKGLLDEVDLLRKEKDSLTELSEKLEKSKKDLAEILSNVQSQLDLPEDTMTRLLSGGVDSKKIFREKMNNLVKAQTEELKADNKNLKLSNENLKEKVKQLTKLLCESASEAKQDLSALSVSQASPMNLRSRSNKNIDLCVRRLDKLEDINHNLTELLTRVLTMTELADVEKLRLCSARDYPNITKKVVAHIAGFQARLKDLQEENAQLDEECETYSNVIKNLEKQAAAVWRENSEKTEAMEAEISRLTGEKASWETERQDLLGKLSKLETDYQKLKSSPKPEGPPQSCNCGNEVKKINELKRTILIKEQKLLELQDLEAQTSSYKSQIEYLKSALEREKRKVGEEKERSKKLENELSEAAKRQKPEGRKVEQSEMLEELRMRGSISGGVVQEFVEKEKIRKLSKDIGILKEMCRARYAEIKRLEAVNEALRNSVPKNSNQMDSPIRPRGYSTRSKNAIRDVWKSGISGKENSPLRADVL